jgi:hypothetical protein
MAAMTRATPSRPGASGFLHLAHLWATNPLEDCQCRSTFAREDEGVFAIGEAMAASGTVFELVRAAVGSEAHAPRSSNEAGSTTSWSGWRAARKRPDCRSRFSNRRVFMEHPGDARKHVLAFVCEGECRTVPRNATVFRNTPLAAGPGLLPRACKSNHQFQRAATTYLKIANLASHR